mmetsp:Transcript_16579/g.29996  ORF Transcript_16579/g.29996 Transcript_16579/m.29996 type:complete len:225 (+) Transcript_16579:303-977(+)
MTDVETRFQCVVAATAAAMKVVDIRHRSRISIIVLDMDITIIIAIAFITVIALVIVITSIIIIIIIIAIFIICNMAMVFPMNSSSFLTHRLVLLLISRHHLRMLRIIKKMTDMVANTIGAIHRTFIIISTIIIIITTNSTGPQKIIADQLCEAAADFNRRMYGTRDPTRRVYGIVVHDIRGRREQEPPRLLLGACRRLRPALQTLDHVVQLTVRQGRRAPGKRG